jgi:hypothetical protein
MATSELAAELPIDLWAVLGGQMVVLHATEHGVALPSDRQTTDGDVIVDVRLSPKATKRTAQILVRLGFHPDLGPGGEGHRFRRGDAAIDVLAPDGLGKRAVLETVSGSRTISAPAGTQALKRADYLTVRIDETVVRIRRPSLLGAIVVKAAAAASLPAPHKHLRDLALLLTLVDDPSAMQAEISNNERLLLRRRDELLEPSHPAWVGIRDAQRGRAALTILGADRLT